MIDYTLIRSKRKTIAIYVNNGEVEVRAPLKVSKGDIDRFVASKENWIRDKQAVSSERQKQRENFALAYGDCITYRGKQYPIEAKDGNQVGFDDERFYMPPGLSTEQIKVVCVQIYRLLAKRDMIVKTLHFAERMEVMPSAIKINGATTRWGSCSAKKSLNFSWRLIMADDDVIDYVVVHELAHITEMNHSKCFWEIVKSVLPDYVVLKAKLKALQQKLSVEDWEE